VDEASTPFPVIRELLDKTGVRYALIGGHAVNAYAPARLTADIDLLVASKSGGVGNVVGAFLRDGWRLDAEYGALQRSGPDFVRLVKDGFPPLEIQASKTDLQEGILARAKLDQSSGLPIATPEDLVILKLIAYRPKDQGDLAALAALPGIDWPLVEAHCLEWKVTARLAAVRKMAAE